MHESERSRRRELQRRAFGPGAGLDEDEVAELRRLDALLASAPSLAVEHLPVSTDASVVPDAAVVPDASVVPDAAGVSDVPVGPSSSAPSPAERGYVTEQPQVRRRRSVPTLLLVTLVALLLGFGGGWVLVNRSDAPTMTAEQVSAMAQIEKRGRFDPGSVVFLGEKYGASIWKATAGDGKQICMAIQLGDQDQYQCITPDADADDPSRERLGVSLTSDDGGTQWAYWATLLTDIAGREALVVQRQDMTAESTWESQFTEVEQAQIDKLVERGVAPEYLQVVGYDGATPVFLTQDAQTCIHLIDPSTGDVRQSCDRSADDVISLRSGDTVYEVQETEMRGPLLTVRRSGE